MPGPMPDTSHIIAIVALCQAEQLLIARRTSDHLDLYCEPLNPSENRVPLLAQNLFKSPIAAKNKPHITVGNFTYHPYIVQVPLHQAAQLCMDNFPKDLREKVHLQPRKNRQLPHTNWHPVGFADLPAMLAQGQFGPNSAAILRHVMPHVLAA